MSSRNITNCRLCAKSEFFEVINLGYTPLADRFLLELNVNQPYIYYELKLLQCQNCGWNQIGNVIDPQILYQQDYPYDSSITKTGNQHWNNFANDCFSRYKLNNNSKVIDIGSNVGALLKNFKDLGVKCLGIDPSETAASIAISRGIETKIAFFSSSEARNILDIFGKADLITGSNVVAHVDNLNDFFDGIALLLSKSGVFRFEAPYFRNLVKYNQFDTIYHEHLSYLTISPLISFLVKFDLEIINIEEFPIHGGSLRVDIARKGSYDIMQSVQKYLEIETIEELNSASKMLEFSSRIKLLRIKMRKLICEIQDQGKTIGVASAPAKGMTFLHYVGLTHTDFVAVSDAASQKINKYLPGVFMRVISDDDLVKIKPDYVLILAWNFAPEIVGKLRNVMPTKTKYIIPIPQPVVI